MSVTGMYRVQCSGGCARWLGLSKDSEWEPQPLDGRRSQIAEFRDWAEANKAAAYAGWFDGPQGEYAKCSCVPLKPVDMPWGRLVGPQHRDDCRLMQPRLVPICPPCRENL